jgi:serine/threonine protein kinase
VSLLPPGAPLSLTPGLKLDRYELLCPIAEGGMATVWIARRTGSKAGFEKLVAIKTILPKFAADVRFQRMFVAEARLASRIEHINVAQILDVGEQQEMTYLVMEYVDGEALSKVHRALGRKGTLIPPGILLRIMADACAGLHAAHDLHDEHGALLGVVHRDVSPQNVLVSRTGIVKLIDFGIAVARDRFGADTNAGQLKGKVHYMAPEHVLGRPVDRRTDVWAAGAVLHHLLSGTPPFEGENEMHTILMIKNALPPPPLPDTVHPAVGAVAMRALSPIPDERFATAADMQDALENAMVEANLKTTTVAVSSFLEEIAGDHARMRKEAIALGLKLAAERDQVAEMMRANVGTTGTTSSGGVSSSAAQTMNTASESPAALRPATGAPQGAPASKRERLTAVFWGAVVGALLAVATLLVLATRPSSAGSHAKPVELVPSILPSSLVAAPSIPDATPKAAASAKANDAPVTPVPDAGPTEPQVAVSSLPSARPSPRPMPRPGHPPRPRVNDGF